jgi:hypothetical protein
MTRAVLMRIQAVSPVSMLDKRSPPLVLDGEGMRQM